MTQMLSDLWLRLTELRPPAPQFTEKDVPDQTGKVILVTGANTGLGLRTSTVLASKGAKVWMAARSREKGEAAVNEVREETGSDNVHFLQLDLADLKKVKEAARKLREQEKRLDVLILNAGVMLPPLGSKTADGLELQFGTNVVGHEALFEHLKPLLLETAKASPAGSVRVVSLASSGHELPPTGGIFLDDLFQEKLARFRPAFQRRANLYGSSKLGNIILANEIARRHKADNILACSLNPGNISTDLARHILPDFIPRLAQKMTFILSVELGSLTQIYCATSPELTMDDSGGYFIPVARRGHCYRSEGHDKALAEQVWDFGLECMQKAGAAADGS